MVTITYAETNPGFQMATIDDLQLLQAVVLARYPQLAPGPGREEVYRASFRRSFWVLGRLGRRAEPETRNAHSATWWLEHCRELLDRANNYGEDIGLHSWVAALVAHGDIPYSRLDRFPFDLSFGLIFGGAGRPATDRWRRVLETGQLLPPVDLTIPKWETAPARLIQAGHTHV